MRRPIPPFSSLRELLAKSPSETTPLLLELARRQARRRSPRDLLQQAARDDFVEPSALDQRVLHRIDGLALEAAAEYQAVKLSPVAPLGACSVIAPTSQDRTLSAARGLEVVSDPTNVLAIECARRLRNDPCSSVRLGSIHQVLRAQELPREPGFVRHFRLLALADAGRARPDHAFEVEAIARQLAACLRLFDACRTLGLELESRRATILRQPGKEALADRVQARLEQDFPALDLASGELDSTYYDGLRVLMSARDQDGREPPLVDVGLFDWVAQLTSNRRLRYVASGCGLELMLQRFQEAGASSNGR